MPKAYSSPGVQCIIVPVEVCVLQEYTCITVSDLVLSEKITASNARGVKSYFEIISVNIGGLGVTTSQILGSRSGIWGEPPKLK